MTRTVRPSSIQPKTVASSERRSPTLKVISWNVNRRREVADQVHALAERLPHIIGLQEVTPGTVACWVDALKAAGFHHLGATVTNGSSVRRGPHANGVLIASRYPIGDRARVAFAVPSWEEKVLSLLINTPLGALAMHNVHVPNGSDNDWGKVEVLEAVYQGLSGRSWNRHTVLCGDFNTPQCELPSGQIVTWAQYEDDAGHYRLARRITGGSGLRWDTAERNILSGLQVFGMRDVFRSLHGYEVEACSWIMRRKKLTRPGVSITSLPPTG